MATNKKKILVTESFSARGRALLAARDDIEMVEFSNMISAADFETLLKGMRRCMAWRWAPPASARPELEASGDMKVVTRIGVGYDAVDVTALSRRKVPLMVAGTANSPSVAEQALFMMLWLAKRAVEMHALVKDGSWGTRLGKLPFDLYGKTVLIIGFGRIGTRTAKRCLAMEMQVLVYDPYKPAAEIEAAGCEPVAGSRRRLAARRLRHHPLPEDAGNGRPVQRRTPEADEADLLSHQHRPRRPGRREGAARCAGRGWHRRRRARRVRAGAAAARPLAACLPNVIMAPHVAGVTREAVDRMSEQTARNILSVLDGEPIRQNVINQDVL